MAPPSLQVRGRAARGGRSIEDIGFPVGRPQTIAVDLARQIPVAVARGADRHEHADLLGSDSRRGRAAASLPKLTRLDPAAADLQWRGLLARDHARRPRAVGYDYDRVSTHSPWKTFVGRYTREGDVRALLARVGRHVRVARPGDEIALSFDAHALPPLAGGLDAHVPALRARLQQGDEHPLGEPRHRRPAAVPRDDAAIRTGRMSTIRTATRVSRVSGRYNTRVVSRAIA